MDSNNKSIIIIIIVIMIIIIIIMIINHTVLSPLRVHNFCSVSLMRTENVLGVFV